VAFRGEDTAGRNGRRGEERDRKGGEGEEM